MFEAEKETEKTETVLFRTAPTKPMRFVEWRTWPFGKDKKGKPCPQPTVSSSGIVEKDHIEDIRELFEFYGFTVYYRDVSVDL